MRTLDNIHAVPLTGPISVTGATNCDTFNMGKSQGARIFVMAGTLAVNLVITVLKGTTAALGASAAIAFRYRETAAVGTDTMGAWQTATTAGMTLTGTTDNNITVEILLESAEFTPVSGTEYPYGVVTMTPGSSSACLIAVIGIFAPRYAQAVPPSQVT